MRGTLALLLWSLTLAVSAQVDGGQGQTPSSPAQTAAAGAGQATKSAPVVAQEYSPDEFPSWARALRRAEILAVGAFPVTMLLSGLGFDYVYYLGNNFPSANVPWPVGSGTSSWTPTANASQLASKNLTILLTSAGMALAIAAADGLIGWLSESAPR